MSVLDEYNYRTAAKRQSLYCEHKHLPEFAPNGGLCWFCGRNIYNQYKDMTTGEVSSGYTISQAGNQHITVCPFCHNSFCE